MSLLPKRVEYSRKALRWLDTDYPERLQDMEEWLTCKAFWDRWEGNQTIQDTWNDAAVSTRAIVEAKLTALDSALDLQEKTEQLVVSMLVDAHKEHWHQYEEIDDFVQFLYEKLEKYMAAYQAKREQGMKVEIPGSVYEIKDAIQVIDTLVEMGIPKENIVAMQYGVSKVKYAAKDLKKIAASDKPHKEKQKKIMQILEEVADPKVSVDTFLERRKQRSREETGATPPLDGKVVILPQGELLFIRSPQSSFTNAIKYQLKGLVDWTPTDATELAVQLTDEVYTKDKYKPTRFYYGRLVQDGREGIVMPTQKRFAELCWIQMGRTLRYISEIINLSPDGKAELTIFEIGMKCKTKDTLLEHLRKEFRTDVLELDRLEEAIQSFYYVPDEMQALYNTNSLQVWWRPNMSLEVRLICSSLGGSVTVNLLEDTGEEKMPILSEEV